MDDQRLARLLEKACPRPSFLASTDGGPALALALHCLLVDAGFILAREGGDAGSSDPEARFMPQKDWNGMLLEQWVFTYTHPGKARKFTLHCSLQKKSKRMFIHSCEENNFANVQVLGLQLDNYVPHPEALRSNNWAAGAAPTPTPTPIQTPVVPSSEQQQQQQEQQQQQQEQQQQATPDQPQVEAEESDHNRPVVRNVPKMSELLTQYVITPLLQAAEDEQGPPPLPPPPAATAAAAEQQQQQAGGSWLWPSQAERGRGRDRPAAANYLPAAAAVALAVGVAVLMLSRKPAGLLARRDF